MAGGRPLKYKDVDEMQAKIDAYFESCYQDMPQKDDAGNVVSITRLQIRPFTITGLALALDLDRDALLNYQGKPGFHDTIKKAKMRIHNFAEEQLFTNRNAAGVIFNLKNNYGWRDKSEVEANVNATVDINVTIVED